MRYFTSDLHFWHTNVIEFCSRPWPDVESMNAGLIENWNKTVTEDDEVYMLGDMFFSGTQRSAIILKQLRGKKYWIMGNHDWGKIKKHRAVEFGIEWMCDKFCVRIGREDVKLSHFPYAGSGDHTEMERYTEHRYEDDGGWLLCGHVHQMWKQKKRMINVGVDVWDYKPVAEAEILKLIESEQAYEKEFEDKF